MIRLALISGSCDSVYGENLNALLGQFGIKAPIFKDLFLKNSSIYKPNVHLSVGVSVISSSSVQSKSKVNFQFISCNVMFQHIFFEFMLKHIDRITCYDLFCFVKILQQEVVLPLDIVANQVFGYLTSLQGKTGRFAFLNFV